MKSGVNLRSAKKSIQKKTGNNGDKKVDQKHQRRSEAETSKDGKSKVMSKTQIRNLRKRESKKRSQGLVGDGTKIDPSLKYFGSPMKAPVVHHARQFFRSLPKENRLNDLKVICGNKEGWRIQAKLAVRRSSPGAAPLVGIFAAGTHEVLPARDCPVHHPAINKAIEVIERACLRSAYPVVGYCDEEGSGDLRYVQLTVERTSELVQLVLVWNEKSLEEANPSLRMFVKTLYKESPDLWHSVWVNLNKPWKHSGRIMSYESRDWIHLRGDANYIKQKLSTVRLPRSFKTPELHFGPNVFIQSNLTGFEAILNSLRKYVPQESKIVELYGGVGTIGVHLADLCSSLECSDENPNNAACVRATLSSLPVQFRKKINYTTCDAAMQVARIPHADVVIVDPPRKGLDDKIIVALQNPGPGTLIYVSCGFSAFRRDCEALIKQKGSSWNLAHAEGHILFPGSDHIEILAVFRRKGHHDCTETTEKHGKRQKDPNSTRHWKDVLQQFKKARSK